MSIDRLCSLNTASLSCASFSTPRSPMCWGIFSKITSGVYQRERIRWKIFRIDFFPLPSPLISLIVGFSLLFNPFCVNFISNDLSIFDWFFKSWKELDLNTNDLKSNRIKSKFLFISDQAFYYVFFFAKLNFSWFKMTPRRTRVWLNSSQTAVNIAKLSGTWALFPIPAERASLIFNLPHPKRRKRKKEKIKLKILKKKKNRWDAEMRIEDWNC